MPFFFRNYLIYIWNRVLVISPDGWRIGQRDLHRSPPCLFSIVSTIFFILIENDNIYTNLLSKSWYFGVFADMSARSSRKKMVRIFRKRFFSHSQWCVSVSASNFCSPIYSSGSRDTALGSFLNAGPARTLYSKSLTAAVEVTSTI